MHRLDPPRLIIGTGVPDQVDWRVRAEAERLKNARLEAERYVLLFIKKIANNHTRRAYKRACANFLLWYIDNGGRGLDSIQPLHVAAWLRKLQDEKSASSSNQQLTALRLFFEGLVKGRVVETNPTASLRGAKHGVKISVTPTLDAAEWRRLIDSISTKSVRDLRDRALIATLTYTFARISVALKMRVEDLLLRGGGWQVRLREKGGMPRAVPCHPALAKTLRAYIDAAGIDLDRKGWLFRTSPRRDAMSLTRLPMTQVDAWRMIRRRARAADINAPIGSHSFRATGIEVYLSNGGTLEHAQSMAGHESPRTTKLYDRVQKHPMQIEVDRIRLE